MLTGSIKLLVNPIPGTNKVKFYADHDRIRAKVVRVDTPQELYAEYRLYKLDVIQKFGPIVSIVTPNCYAAFMASRVAAAPPKIQPPISPPENKEDFEVNMMEALIGWKGWIVGKNLKFLMSTYESVWHPNEPFQASCGSKKCNSVSCPNESCTCGIYAADKEEGAHAGADKVRGRIYGWGRYIRGDAGWRAQYAYPKEFLINEDQIQHLELLKQYHVPIFVKQPLKIYDPVDDGFQGEDDGNRKEEEDRDGGAGEGPAAS